MLSRADARESREHLFWRSGPVSATVTSSPTVWSGSAAFIVCPCGPMRLGIRAVPPRSTIRALSDATHCLRAPLSVDLPLTCRQRPQCNGAAFASNSRAVKKTRSGDWGDIVGALWRVSKLGITDAATRVTNRCQEKPLGSSCARIMSPTAANNRYVHGRRYCCYPTCASTSSFSRQC